MVCAFITVVMLLGVIVIVFVLACHKVGRHIAQNPEAAKQVMEHVVLPLLKPEEKKGDAPVDDRPEPKKIKATLL
jgi:hypothetical protein